MIKHGGVKLLVTQKKQLAVKVAVSMLGGFSTGVSSICLSNLGRSLLVVLLRDKIDCDELFYKLPNLSPGVSYLERIEDRKDKVLVQVGNDEKLFLTDNIQSDIVELDTIEGKRYIFDREVARHNIKRSQTCEASEFKDDLNDISEVVKEDDSFVRERTERIVRKIKTTND